MDDELCNNRHLFFSIIENNSQFNSSMKLQDEKSTNQELNVTLMELSQIIIRKNFI